MDTNIEIVNGRVFVNGKETVDPTFIGYAMLDFAEQKQNHPLTNEDMQPVFRKAIRRIFIIFVLKIIGIIICACAFLSLVHYLAFLKF